jgi:hypothetical protein
MKTNSLSKLVHLAPGTFTIGTGNARRIRLLITRVIACVALASAAGLPLRATPEATPLVTKPAADVVWQTGLIGIFDHEARDTFASVELRLRKHWQHLRPWTGLTIVDSGAWFAGAGLIADVPLSPKSRLTIGTGPFYYSHGEDEDDDLGFNLEFYSFAELSWVWKRDLRLGLRLGHLSNAGLGRKNPGTEILSLVVSVPLEDRPAKSGSL